MPSVHAKGHFARETCYVREETFLQEQDIQDSDDVLHGRTFCPSVKKDMWGSCSGACRNLVTKCTI